eukprot:TRINITY_DN35322_c0_g1_i2.p1 TRINITY_DN35322_c0_g1~~TRINITY_DN35322_c0_g1_i2.p1  ORF type:complete len:372 (+),score=32.06 TRINITY_DN35322_c0_g1_i2:78-1118(+)
MQYYHVKKLLQDSKISAVYIAEHKLNGFELVLKCYKLHELTEVQRLQAAREIEYHSRLTHPGVIQMYGSWFDDKMIYIAMELASVGDLYSIINKQQGLHQTVVVSCVIRPLLQALYFVHQQGILHRDIKPENILVGTCGVKIADFGLCINIQEERANTRLGTLDYMAPETFCMPKKQFPMDFKQGIATITYNQKVDCWAVGVLAYELLTGRPPFEQQTMQMTITSILNDVQLYSSKMSHSAQHFIDKALQKDPSKRWDIEQLLKHPWINSCTTSFCLDSLLGVVKLNEDKFANSELNYSSLQQLNCKPFEKSNVEKHSCENSVNIPGWERIFLEIEPKESIVVKRL